MRNIFVCHGLGLVGLRETVIITKSSLSHETLNFKKDGRKNINHHVSVCDYTAADTGGVLFKLVHTLYDNHLWMATYADIGLAASLVVYVSDL